MAETKHCCICGADCHEPYHIIGQRVYCDKHFKLVNKTHSGFWRAGVIQIIGMALFALAVSFLASRMGLLAGTPLLLAGLFLAVVPTVLWLVFFYQQDRLEPEPKTKIAIVFVVAFLLMDVVGRRVIEWFEIGTWATSTTTSLLAYMLILGMVYQVVAYVAVRSTVLLTEEFDERMDGMVYGTVAGLGVATLLNLRYVLDNNGVNLATGVIAVVTTALAQASFGGLLGYFLAEAKFTHKPLLWVPLGFALCALLNGLFTWLIGEVSSSGLNVLPIRSLIVGVVVAIVAFFVLIGLMRRAISMTLQGNTQAS